jgi:uncharacterized lipoprotein YmbA
MKRLAFVLTMVLAGCSPLAPRPDPSRYYVLTPPSAPDPPPGEGAAGVVIGLGPVALPSYLARPEVATRVGPNQISYSPVARWAAPLHSTITQVLADTVEGELGAAEVIPFPSFGAARLDYVVEIGLRRFECNGEGAATLEAVWTIRDAHGRAALATRATTVSEPVNSSGTAAEVAALSATLGDLAREIAEGIRWARGGAGDGPQPRARSTPN